MKEYRTIIAKHSECVYVEFNDLKWTTSKISHEKLSDAKTYLLSSKHDFGFQLILDNEDIIRYCVHVKQNKYILFNENEIIQIYKWLRKTGYI